jgi:hypothetical protein
MADPKCGQCSLRARYDRNPKSFLGRFWRWHTKWCPGWKAYLKSLPENKQAEIREKYRMPDPDRK